MPNRVRAVEGAILPIVEQCFMIFAECNIFVNTSGKKNLLSAGVRGNIFFLSNFIEPKSILKNVGCTFILELEINGDTRGAIVQFD